MESYIFYSRKVANNVLMPLRVEVLFMEIVFVGECEVFVCLCFVVSFFFPWPRSS